MKYLFIVYITLFISSCAAPQKDLNPKSFLYNAEGSRRLNIKALNTALVQEGFQIRSYDQVYGSLTTEQRAYSIESSEKLMEQLLVTINIHQERSNLKITLSFLCRKSGEPSICSRQDQGLMSQVHKIQNRIDQMAESIIK